MFRRVKGKWVAGRKDTWDMGEALKPIIAAGIRKFIEVITDPNNHNVGVPSIYLQYEYPDIQCLNLDHDIRVEEGFQEFLADLHECLWFFEFDEMKEIFDLDLDYDSRTKLLAEVEVRKKKALQTFAKIYELMWW